MVNKLADKLSRLSIEAEVCKDSDYEVLSYGYKKIINYLIQIAILISIALLFGLLIEMFPFVLFYCVLRPKVGGAHAKTHFGCVGTFTVIAVVAAILVKHTTLSMMLLVSRTTAVTSWGIVFSLAPVTHSNAPKKEQSLAKCKRQGRQIVTAQVIFIIITGLICPLKIMPLVTAASLGIAVVSAMLIIPYIHRRLEV